MRLTTARDILLFTLILLCSGSVSAQDRTATKDNKPGIYDNLYDIYLLASKNRSNEQTVHYSDSMRTLAVLQGDKRAVAMSWANPLTYYLNTNQEEKFFETAENLMKASEEAELWSFYYHAITQQSIFYLRRNRLGETLELAQSSMDKAYADNNVNGIYASHIIFSNCYSLMGLFDKAIEEAEKAIEAEVGLPDTNFGNGVSKLVEIYYKKRDWQAVMDVIAKYEDQIAINATLVHMSAMKSICSYWMGNKEDYRRYLEEWKGRVEKYGESTQKGQGLKLEGIRLMEEGRYKEAEAAFDQVGNPDKFYCLFQLAKKAGDADKMENAMTRLAEYYNKQNKNNYEADIKKYELEFENYNLERENKMLEMQKKQMLTSWILGILALLLIFGFILFYNARRTNRKLREANGVLSDQKKRLEDSIAAMEKANSENEAKTSFLFNMSHDIRTPMNAIIGFRDMLEKYQDDPEKRTDYLKKIGDSSKVLLSIINNVLEMSRIEKGTLELNEEPMDVNKSFGQIFDSFEDQMRQKQVTFTLQSNVKHNNVYGDQAKLRGIFNNILSNAYKYTLPGGKVTMSIDELPAETPGRVLLRTTVTDTGVGMSKEFLPHLFEEFAREDNSSGNKIEGTGLGMPIVKRLVEIMHGTVVAESEKGVGSVFTVTIPLRITEEPTVAETDADVHPSQFVGKRLLLAEDNDLNAEIASDILGEYGIVVDRAENGLKAVEMVEAAPYGHYSMVLMDVQMPVLNGYEATKAIRALEDKEKASIPIVAMTANAFDEDRQAALNAGMNAHLAKPIEIEELFNALARYTAPRDPSAS